MGTQENPPNVTALRQALPEANTQAPSPPPALADGAVLTPSLVTCSVPLLPAPPTATTLASLITLGLDPSKDDPDSHAGGGVQSWPQS